MTQLSNGRGELAALDELASRDAAVRRALERYGAPAMWVRAPGFATLLRSIVEQQVSLASAGAMFQRLEEAISDVTPRAFLRLDDEELRVVGLSRQKMRYGRELARALLDGTLDLDVLDTLSDAEARRRLQALPGIGPWTCDMYLLMALRRPDVWPAGDVAVAGGARRILELAERPAPSELRRIGERWRPLRSAAALLCWHVYRQP